MLGKFNLEAKEEISVEFQTKLELANKGDAQAQTYVGRCYATGRGVKQNHVQAIAWYEKAAAQGDAAAQFRLGHCYDKGQGVKRDYDQAFVWYQKAAMQEHAAAQFRLGHCYHNGEGVKQDYALAVRWFEKAAHQGHAAAQASLGVCYSNGQGVKQDYAQATKWLQKSADQGYAHGQCKLGICYYDGQGVEQDYSQAVKWFEKAAEQGLADAQYSLGICYANGLRGKQDYSQALALFQKAAAQGHHEARQGAEVLQKQSHKADVSLPLTISYKELASCEKISQGATAIVYKATWRGKPVAVKQVLSADFSLGAREKFKMENTIMARLHSPNIVQFYGYCPSPQYWLVMEYMPKGSLYSLLHGKEELGLPVLYRLATDMACGLAYLHANKILHCDIKSSNVVVDENLRAKLCDFGISRIMTETSTSIEKDIRPLGAFAWRAPELADEKAPYTTKADIFSLGMTFWELAARRLPFASVPKVNKMIVVEAAKGKREKIPDNCPKKMASLIQFCWEGKPDNRPSADEIVAYLRSDTNDFGQFAVAAGSKKDQRLGI